jgi:hypothetical protein
VSAERIAQQVHLLPALVLNKIAQEMRNGLHTGIQHRHGIQREHGYDHFLLLRKMIYHIPEIAQRSE